MTKDPVCGMNVDERTSEFKTHFDGRDYSFCSENCKQDFDADPEEFVGQVAA
ncbi:MAG: YHS domain-containing protein [Candidatus Sulfotelmatobacter sp.]